MIRIIGAGFSGLSLAYFFTKLGYPVTVIEKNSRTGGVISSEYKNNMLIESAANGFLASEKLEDMFADIGVQALVPKSESRKKYIFRNGLRRWPLSLDETVVLVGRAVFAFISGRSKPREDESLKDWAQRVLGLAGNDYLIQPMVNGIFAQKTEILSAKMVLGSMFFKKKRKTLKGLISAPNGMGEVIQKLESYLKIKGVRFELSTDEKMHSSVLQHNTFLATDLFSAKSFFAMSNTKQPEIKKDDLTCLSLVRVTLNFKNQVNQIDGFGVLFPNKEKFFTLGVLANSKIFENRGDYNESWILGDSVLPDLMNLSDDQIIEKIKQDRLRLFPQAIEIKDVSIHRWKEVVPCYDHLLQRFLKENAALTSNLAGNYLGVLGLTGIHERNSQIASAYAERNKK
tara:strand:- start:3860 stop:5059 length:1200 start_codon:yes stop_codon:yes gene_type:complete